ncbi:MAG: NAD(P)-dependent oxidoreductase [Eubacteriales bacterium]|nr:NAD(P)-dependent oxidoreductase [Eubacteriales bacterium]
MKVKEILLAGNTGYVTVDFIRKAFPGCHVLIAGNPSLKTDKRNHITSFTTLLKEKDLQEIFRAYEFDSVIYFSNYLTFHGDLEGELEQLRKMMQNSRAESNVQIIYLAGPEGGYSVHTGKTVLADSAEQLCMHYSEINHMQIKIVRLPYLYSGTYERDYFFRTFAQMEKEQEIVLTESEEQKVCFLCMDDLAELLYRMLDGWDKKTEILSVPDSFGITFGELGEALDRLKEGTVVRCEGEAVVQQMPDNDMILRYRYGWFPKISILVDLPAVYESYGEHRKLKPGRWEQLREWLRLRGRVLKGAELVAGGLMVELLNHMMGTQVEFRLVDLRLLFVVLMGTIHGMNTGIAAAVLETLSLAAAYYRQETGWFTLFFEPSNWIPFIVYLMAGAVCGYVRLKNRDDISYARKEKDLLQEKFYFVRSLYQDTLQDKKEYKKQILGSRDSFGKIFDITRQLDVVRPQEVFIKTIQVMEKVMENQTISIYSLGENQSFARLEAASREMVRQLPKSLRMADYREAISKLEEGEVWSNGKLLEGYPMYMAGIRKDSRLVMMIMIREADYSQMTLYYLNLFKILCGLVQTSLLRALEYQKVMRGEQYLEGMNIMKETYFLERLQLQHSMAQQKVAEYTLLKLERQEMTLQEANERLISKIRETDVLGLASDGNLYLILTQTAPETARLVVNRLEQVGFHCEIVEQPEED